MKRQEKIQINFLVLIGIMIFTLIVAIMTLVKNIDELKLDPVEYAIKHTELNQCTCFDSIGALVSYPREQDVIQNWTK